MARFIGDRPFRGARPVGKTGRPSLRCAAWFPDSQVQTTRTILQPQAENTEHGAQPNQLYPLGSVQVGAHSGTCLTMSETEDRPALPAAKWPSCGKRVRRTHSGQAVPVKKGAPATSSLQILSQLPPSKTGEEMAGWGLIRFPHPCLGHSSTRSKPKKCAVHAYFRG